MKCKSCQNSHGRKPPSMSSKLKFFLYSSSCLQNFLIYDAYFLIDLLQLSVSSTCFILIRNMNSIYYIQSSSNQQWQLKRKQMFRTELWKLSSINVTVKTGYTFFYKKLICKKLMPNILTNSYHFAWGMLRSFWKWNARIL